MTLAAPAMLSCIVWSLCSDGSGRNPRSDRPRDLAHSQRRCSVQLAVFGNLHIESFRAQRSKNDITAAIIGSGRRNASNGQSHRGGYRKSSRAESVEIEEVDRATDQKKKEDEEKYQGSAAALIVRLARDEVRGVRRFQRQAPVLA